MKQGKFDSFIHMIWYVYRYVYIYMNKIHRHLKPFVCCFASQRSFFSSNQKGAFCFQECLFVFIYTLYMYIYYVYNMNIHIYIALSCTCCHNSNFGIVIVRHEAYFLWVFFPFASLWEMMIPWWRILLPRALVIPAWLECFLFLQWPKHSAMWRQRGFWRFLKVMDLRCFCFLGNLFWFSAWQ